MKQKIRVLAMDTVFDIAGSILFALGIYTFAKATGFAPGGVSGLALIINYLFRLPIGVVSLLLNVPIILISYRALGRGFLIKSVRTMLINTVFLDLVFPHLPIYTGNSFLAALFTGVFVGSGLALIYMRGSSTGGADFLIIAVRNKFPHFSLGQITMVADTIVIVLGGIVFGNIDSVLYGIISTFATSYVIDKVMYGAGSGKLAIIITDCGREVAAQIIRSTTRSCTIVPATGAYSGANRDMVLCACSKPEIVKVRNAAHYTDPSAFVMITEASEVFGEGFKPPELRSDKQL